MVYSSVTSPCSSDRLTTEGKNMVEGIPKHIHEVLSFRKNYELKIPKGVMCKVQKVRVS